jgi:hypothetical protein
MSRFSASRTEMMRMISSPCSASRYTCATTKQDGGVRRRLCHSKDYPSLLSGVIVDAIHVNKAAFVFEYQRGQFE